MQLLATCPFVYLCVYVGYYFFIYSHTHIHTTTHIVASIITLDASTLKVSGSIELPGLTSSNAFIDGPGGLTMDGPLAVTDASSLRP